MFQSSIVSYGENGRDKRYGKSSYRGNTDGGIVIDFLDYVKAQFGREAETCSDYMSGSFTTRDVCKERGIGGVYWDLSTGQNLLDKNLEIVDRPETIFWHPPYSSVINIPYAGAEWGATKTWTKDQYGKNHCEIKEDLSSYIKQYGFDPKPYDLGRMDWPEFIKALNYCCLKQFAALETGGYMGILMGDIRRQGKYYSMLLDIAKPGDVKSIVIKKQNNTMSANTKYSSNKFIPIEQEYFLILQKMAAYILDFTYTKKVKLDIRDSVDTPWRQCIVAVMEEKGKPLTEKEIEAEFAGRKKAEKNNNLSAKVRQQVNNQKYFVRVDGNRFMPRKAVA